MQSISKFLKWIPGFSLMQLARLQINTRSCINSLFCQLLLLRPRSAKRTYYSQLLIFIVPFSWKFLCMLNA